MSNKRPFTLFEMMVVLAILSVIGALTTVHIKKLIDVHRFESEVSDLFIALQEAQVLSAAYQTDLALDIFRKGGILYYHISTDEPLSSRQLDRRDFSLAHTASIHFKDAKAKTLHFNIFAGGRIEPSGILTFRQSKQEESQTLWFDLQRSHLPKFCYRKPPPAKQQISVKPKEV